jgi:hypothetical protein
MESEAKDGSFLLCLAFEVIQDKVLLYINAREARNMYMGRK